MPVQYGSIVAAQNGFEPGNPASGTIYITNGDADDWLYSAATHAPILALTPEVGNDTDYFDPPAARIPDLVIETQNGIGGTTTVVVAGYLEHRTVFSLAPDCRNPHHRV